MNLIKNAQRKYLQYFDVVIYATIFSIFIANFKLYIPMFALNIFMVFTLVLTGDIKLKFKTWQIAVIAFMTWSIISSAISMFLLKNTIDIATVIKLNLNMLFLLATSMVIYEKSISFGTGKLMNFLEFIIIINFIQILSIYVFGGLLSQFISGGLTESSDTAYYISSFYNVIGSESKNIWAGKFALFFTFYLYIITFDDFIISKLRKTIHIVMGILTLLLLLSRTAQMAIIIPIIVVMFYLIKDIPRKYKIAIYSIFILGTIFVMFIFFTKFFHIKFDVTDGGYTRLLIWQSFLQNVWDTNFIMGNGIGCSGDFIQNIVGRSESNLHNVYFNIFFEMGMIGFASYITFLIAFAKDVVVKNRMLNLFLIIIIPFGITTFLQYLGFDNDIIIVFIFLLILKKKHMNKDFHK